MRLKNEVADGLGTRLAVCAFAVLHHIGVLPVNTHTIDLMNYGVISVSKIDIPSTSVRNFMQVVQNFMQAVQKKCKRSKLHASGQNYTQAGPVSQRIVSDRG